jgi:hypothetical protein
MQRPTSSTRRSARLLSRLFALLLVAGLLGNTTGLLGPVLALLACFRMLVCLLCILARIPKLFSIG